MSTVASSPGNRPSRQSVDVAVLMGGWSAEREVSLTSGAACADALARSGFQVRRIDVRRDPVALVESLTPRPTVVFNALHGRGGEDGVIQGLLDMLGLPYTHSGIPASAIAMDKPLTKRVLAGVGVRAPDGIELQAADLDGRHPLPPPYVLKPADEGSSVGVRVVHAGGNAPAPAAAEWPAGQRLAAEVFIPGRELTVGVMGERALAVTEIEHSHGFFDYDAKYVPGHAVHRIPAQIPAAVTDEAMRIALLAHRTLGCQGISRSDFRWDDAKPGTDGLFFLEINTQPGFTAISLVPEQARHLGIDFDALCAWLVEDALCRA